MALSGREELEAIFDRAMQMPPDARDAFLDDVCGKDASLRDEIASLLVAHDHASDYFDQLAARVVAPALLALADVPDEGLAPGDTVSHYRVVARIGRGGMGVVYAALDLSLGRPVALKFLPAELCSDAKATMRFLAEARTASQLDHPNIGVIHEIGETADGRHFIAMAFYDGETLEQKIARGPLSVDETRLVARQIAAALAAAHAKGVIHRDVKPSNILITTQGIAKLLDFGIATVPGSDSASEGSAAHGTVAYMSPEQTREECVDQRSDLWSLGIVLYEMLTGVRPFEGGNRTITDATRHDSWARDLHTIENLAPSLARIVARCLEKDASRRYASAERLLADLELAGAKVGLEPSTDHNVAVQMRRERRRGVGYAGLALLTVSFLGMTLIRMPAEFTGMRRAAVTNTPEVHELYARGRYYLDKRDEESVKMARDYFRQALDTDPTYARAWVGWSDTLDVLAWLSVVPPREAYAQSRAAAERALALNSDLPEAHVALARVLFRHDFEFESAAEHLRRAIRLNPNHAEARQLYAAYLRVRGRFDEALEEIETAAALDPLSPMNQVEFGITLYMARRYDEALAQYRQVLETRPDFTSAHFFIALVYLQRNEYDLALAALDRATPSSGWEETTTLRAFIHAVTGQQAAARAQLEALGRRARTQYVSPWYPAIIHLGIGNYDQALDLLDLAFEERAWQVPLLPVEPIFEPVRSHPRFIALVDRLRR